MAMNEWKNNILYKAENTSSALVISYLDFRCYFEAN